MGKVIDTVPAAPIVIDPNGLLDSVGAAEADRVIQIQQLLVPLDDLPNSGPVGAWPTVAADQRALVTFAVLVAQGPDGVKMLKCDAGGNLLTKAVL